jgi:hypothetical protein
MFVYKSTGRTGQTVHVPEGIEDVKALVKAHGGKYHRMDMTMLLSGGIVMSSKSIYHHVNKAKPKEMPWEVYHEIDGSVKKYTDNTLMKSSIGKAIDANAFIALVPSSECKCPAKAWVPKK